MIDSIKNNTLGEFVITAVFISFIFLPLFFFAHYAPYLRYDIQAFIISASLAFLVLTIFFVIVFQKTRQYNVLSYYDLLLLPFFFFVLISFSLVSDHLASFQSVLWWLEALIFYFISRFIFINTSTRKRFLDILPGCGVLMTICFAISLFANEEIRENFLFFPIAMNRNYVAQILILPLFISFSFIHKTYNRGTRLYAVISAFVIFCGILISRSRSVWLGVLLAIAVAILWLFLAHRTEVKKFLNKQSILISLVMLVVVGMSLFAAHTIMPKYNFPSPFTTLKTFQKPLEGSSGGRIRRWANSLPMIRDHFLFGVGPGNWAHTFYKYRGSVTPDPQGYPHSFNSYLQLLGETGVFAFLLFIAFISSLFRRNYIDSPQVLFLKLSLGAFLFAAAFHMTFSIKVLLIAIFLNMSLLSSYEKITHRSFVTNKNLFASLNLALGAVLIITSFFEFKYLQSKIHYYHINYHLSYQGTTPYLFFNRKSARSIGKYIEKYFPAIFYREHPQTIESLASYGSGRMRNLYRVIAIKEEAAGRGKEALGWYKKAEKKSPYRADIISARCQLEKELGLISDAQATCERGCKILPQNAFLHLQLAQIYREIGQNQKAIASYEKAISLYEKQLEVDWFGKSGVRKSHRLIANLAMAKKELSQLRNESTLKSFSVIQQKILQVPLINKDIAIRNNDVFFSSNKSGRYELWVWKEDNSLQQLTDDNYVYFHLRPHSTLPRMYFVSDDAGNAKYNIYYRDLNTNEVVRLTNASNNESFGLYEISPDGSNIIYVKESTQHGQEIYQMTHNGKNMRKITSDRKRKEYLSWHPSSKQFVYVTGKRSLILFDVNSSGNRTIIKENMKEIKWPSFSPDGTKLIFARLDRYGYGSIEVLDLKTKKSKVVTMKSGRYLTPQWMSQDSILYRENKDDHYLLRITQLNTDETKHIGPPEGVVYDPEISHSGSLLVFLHSDLTTPISLNRMDLETNYQQTLRFDSLSKEEIVLPERDVLISHGQSFPVYLFKPVGFENDLKYPCILWLHGASSEFSPRWQSYAQFFAQSGYFFVAVNYREVLFGLPKQPKSKELHLQSEAIKTTLSYLHSQKQIDETQIFLIGVSTGTELARYMLATNQLSVAGVIEYSPATMARQIDYRAIPRLIVWGENDPRRLKSFLAEENFFLTPNNNVEVLTIAGEGHDLRLYSSIVSRLKRSLHFLNDQRNH